MESKTRLAIVRLRKFRDAPQSKYLLSLLAALNDLDSLSVLIDALEPKELKTPFLHTRRRDGASFFLSRQQSAIVYSALHDRIKEITEKVEKARAQNHSEKSPDSLWRLILSDPELDSRLSELSELYAQHAQNFGYVRDQLASHIDSSALKAGLDHLSEKHEHGIVFENETHFRALFMDDIISESWQKNAFGLKPGEKATKERMVEESDLIFLVKARTAEFAHMLFMKYCLKFDLFGDDSEREHVSQEIEEYEEKNSADDS